MTIAVERPASELDFQIWLRDSKPGDKLVYHVGNLAKDRQGGTARARNISCIGHAAWRAYENGQVTLVQRRIPGSQQHEYIAQRLKEKHANEWTD